MGLLSVRWTRAGAAHRPHSRAHGTIVGAPGEFADVAPLHHRMPSELIPNLASRAGDRSFQRRRGLRRAALTGGKIR